MTFDPDVVVLRLTMMNDLLADLESVGPVDAQRLRSDRITRHAVERILTQLVELAVSINSHLAAANSGTAPGTYRDSFSAAAEAGAISSQLAARIAPSAGLRNLLTHEYVAVDLDLVAQAALAASIDYRDYVRSVARLLQAGPEGQPA